MTEIYPFNAEEIGQLLYENGWTIHRLFNGVNHSQYSPQILERLIFKNKSVLPSLQITASKLETEIELFISIIAGKEIYADEYEKSEKRLDLMGNYKIVEVKIFGEKFENTPTGCQSLNSTPEYIYNLKELTAIIKNPTTYLTIHD